MPITYKNGNAVSALIDGDIDTLLHCVNCRGAFASGIAGEIRKRIPSAYHEYMEFYQDNKLDMLGKFCWLGSKVVHLAAQNFYGRDGKRYVNYGALSKCLNTFAREVKPYNGNVVKRIGIPYGMCCGLAGGDWEIVLELVEFFLQDFNVVVYKLEN